MTIAIVPALVKSPIRATPAEGPTNGTAATPTADVSADFASILLGLPIAVSKPAANQEETASREAVIAAGDPPLLATLSPLSLNHASKLQAALDPGFESARQTPTEPLLPPTSARIAKEPLKIAATTGDHQQQSAPMASAADDQPARFAVAEFAAPPAEQVVANRPEAASPASALNTLPSPPSHVVNAPRSDEIPRDLQTPLRDAAWGNELGHKLLWFASHDKQLAQLTLHPPQLGSIEITLNLDKDGAKAHFVSPSADVRGAIETAAPRLREMFASAGIELGQVSVGSESLRQQPEGRQAPSHQPRRLADNGILGSDSVGGLPAQSSVTSRGHGLIDIFA